MNTQMYKHKPNLTTEEMTLSEIKDAQPRIQVPNDHQTPKGKRTITLF